MATHTYETFQSASSGLRHDRPGFWAKIGQISLGAFALLVAWQVRATERAHLASLDEHVLHDMGMTRDDARSEAAKPVWQA